MKVKIFPLPGSKIPTRSTEGAAGYDVFAYEDRVIMPGKRSLVSLGFRLAIEKGFYGQLHPRSSFALRNETTVDASVIDSDYRGIVKILFVNHSDKDFFVIANGCKIGQMIFRKCDEVEFEVTDKLDVTERGEGEFGSTGFFLKQNLITF